jgi:formylglycine-generating enzyme required for sulfatase activity
MRPVMQLKPNELGLYDIGGNITEWCWDWYDARYYSYSPSDNPLGAEGGEDRVQRGGSWKYPASSAKASNREYDFPFKGSLTNGLRLCRTAQ